MVPSLTRERKRRSTTLPLHISVSAKSVRYNVFVLVPLLMVIIIWKFLSHYQGTRLELETRLSIATLVVKPFSIEGCQRLRRKSTQRPIYSQSMWLDLQDKYRLAMETSESSIAISPKTGWQVPYEVRQTREKGRSIFATANIKRGETLWKNFHHATFSKELDFRKFLASLELEIACDVLLWAYVSEEGVETESECSEGIESTADEEYCYMAAVELDDASFINHANEAEALNAGPCRPILAEGITCVKEDVFVFALRDIAVGEEILMNYTDFFVGDGELLWFDSLWEEAGYNYGDDKSKSAPGVAVETSQNE